MDANRVIVFDTTLRDGEQSPGISLNDTEKLEIAQQLARLGVDVIEAGFPIASPGDFQAVQKIAQEVQGPIIAGLARAHAADIERAAEAVRDAERPRVHTFISTSDIQTALAGGQTLAQIAEANGKTAQDVIDVLVQAVKDHFTPEVASGEHTQEEADAMIAAATQQITDLVNNGGPIGGRGFGRGGDGDGDHGDDQGSGQSGSDQGGSIDGGPSDAPTTSADA